MNKFWCLVVMLSLSLIRCYLETINKSLQMTQQQMPSENFMDCIILTVALRVQTIEFNLISLNLPIDQSCHN